MSNKCMNWVYESSESKLADRLVLLALADEADDDGGSCYPSVDRLARKARISHRQVLRCIDRLEEQCEVVVDRPKKRGRGHVHHYLLLMGKTEEEARRKGDNLSAGKGAERRGTVRVPVASGLDPLPETNTCAVAEKSNKPHPSDCPDCDGMGLVVNHRNEAVRCLWS